MMKDRYRLSQLFLFFVSAFVLAASFYFQWIKDLHPCPLCIMQRVCVAFAVIFSVLGFFLGQNRGRLVLIALQLIIALCGLYFSGRQLWLQTLSADQMPACLPGLDVLMRYFPWQDIVHALIWGAADCGEVSWQWLGLSMPAWSALYFLGLFLGTLFIAIPCKAFCMRLSRK